MISSPGLEEFDLRKVQEPVEVGAAETAWPYRYIRETQAALAGFLLVDYQTQRPPSLKLKTVATWWVEVLHFFTVFTRYGAGFGVISNRAQCLR